MTERRQTSKEQSSKDLVMRNLFQCARGGLIRAGLAVGLMLASALTPAQTVTYFHNDASGTPVLATDANGNVVWKENYRPYGDRLNNPPAEAGNAIGFAGKPFDASTGLSYMGARYYDPGIGRFMGVDAAPADPGSVHGFNRYAYANNNPYKYVDPDGHSPIDVVFLVWDLGKLGAAVYTGAGVGGAFADVAMSTIGVVSPFPFAGQALKAARAVEHGAELFKAEKAVEHGIEAARGVEAAAAKGIGARVEAVHGALDPIAAGRRTTAALDTVEGTRVLAAGGRDLSPAQRALMAPGEVAAKLPGAHAEVTALGHAAQNGLTPAQMAVSRTICPSCRAAIEQSGGQLTSPTTAIWPR